MCNLKWIPLWKQYHCAGTRWKHSIPTWPIVFDMNLRHSASTLKLIRTKDGLASIIHILPVVPIRCRHWNVTTIWHTHSRHLTHPELSWASVTASVPVLTLWALDPLVKKAATGMLQHVPAKVCSHSYRYRYLPSPGTDGWRCSHAILRFNA